MPERTRSKASFNQPPAAPLAIPSEQRPDAWWWLLVGVIILVAILAVYFPPTPAPPEQQQPIYHRVFVYIISGVGVTIGVTVATYVLTLIVGLLGGLGRLSKSRIVYAATTLYVELARGIPLMVQLLWWYFAFPALIRGMGDKLHVDFLSTFLAPAIPMAVLGLTFCYGAYMSEIYRAGIQSISKGQMEAALSLGMTRFQGLRYIVIPQAIRVILPPMGNEFIALLKDSSLVSVVAVVDLTRKGHEIQSKTFRPIETWVMVALLYLIMTLFSARVVTWLERRTKVER